MLNISVIMPVYNAVAFLRKAVESAVELNDVKEILLIEDGSTDHSLEVCRELSALFDKVKLFQHPDKGNHGAGASRNLGLQRASGDFVAFLDADDYYLPNRFEAEKELFSTANIEGVFGAIGTAFLTEKGRAEFKEKFKNTDLTTVNYPAEGTDVFYGLLGLDKTFGSFFHLNGLTVRSESIRKNNLKFNETLRVHQDTDFIIKLAWHCYLKSGNITQAIAVRGVHDDNRITKIKRYSEKYNQRQLLLWNSVYEWAEDKNIKKEYKEHLFLTKKSFELSLNKGVTKYFNIFAATLKDPKILKTRYRFTYLNR
ncbi:glycosyltransferase family 2 protein [Chryseobacterium sp. HSC-36S06]|uniref:glycosyltransferase family 2 protein n=1 Tax=Chryseobacterium sp. HSC-36S06 TaxID=2910970 RepID=UPI0020A191C6|nr:glycosyltransferase family 2 protein [Chryseobacterium sp. HSC-36S06]MCP2037025.1 glycosyltransferase involved in cell wall biosynthesis [Chryseobacterium sp. HSC-36S06]